jgi:hypothetical protein
LIVDDSPAHELLPRTSSEFLDTVGTAGALGHLIHHEEVGGGDEITTTCPKRVTIDRQLTSSQSGGGLDRFVDPPRPSRFRVLQVWVVAHRRSLAVLVPLLVFAAVLHGFHMLHSPGPNDDEATYVSQAWSVQTHGQLSHYTYWYDHPPLGWLLLAIWNTMLFVLPRHASVWVAGREAMLLVHLVSCALIYVLGRRLRMTRWASAVAVMAFTVSPLGLAWQRLTLLDNIGTPLLLAAWVLALSPKKRLLAYAGAAAAVAAAHRVKETNALVAPFIAFTLWRSSGKENRRFAVALSASTCLALVMIYPLYAALKGELFPGPGHVSLVWALEWQLLLRPGSGSLLNPHSGLRLALASWLHADAPLLVGALLVAPVALWRRESRPVVAAYVALLVMPLRGGYLPAPYPISLVWPAALVLAAGLEWLVRPLAKLPTVACRSAIVIVAVVLAIAGLTALRGDRSYLTADDTRNYRAAEYWITAHVTRDDVLLADNTIWIDLIQRGYSRDRVIWFYKFDLDPAIQRRYPAGWQDVDYVVESSLLVSAMTGQLPWTAAAITNSHVVATFGDIAVRATNVAERPGRRKGRPARTSEALGHAS